MKWPFMTARWQAARLLLFALVSAGGLSCTIVADDEYCLNDESCPADRPVCDDVDHACVPATGCRHDEQCTTAALPQCDRRTSTCVACTPTDDPSMSACAHLSPPRPFCVKQAMTSVCTECLGNMDCPVDRPICDGNACRACREHKECGPEVKCDDGKGNQPCKSWVCISEGDADPIEDLSRRVGHCASSSPTTGRVVYAKKITGFCDDNWPGTPDMPRCTLEAAVLKAVSDGRRYVRLLGSGEPFNLLPPQDLNTPAAHLVIIGAETKSDMPATVMDSGLLFQVSGGANLLLDQLILSERQADTTVLSCSGMLQKSSLTVRGSTVLGVTMGVGVKPAIDSNDCDTALLRNYIGVAPDGTPAPHSIGVQLSDTNGRSYSIIGNIIAGNQGTALLLVKVMNLQARFNTIVNNGGGVNCVIIPATLGQSIIYNKMIQPPGCVLDNVVTDDPKLDKRFHLTSASTLCIDKVPAGAGFPDRDIDGDPRPLGLSYDIGADEYRKPN